MAQFGLDAVRRGDIGVRSLLARSLPAPRDAIDRRIGSPIVVASHPRSGTHLTIDLIRKHFSCATHRLRPMESADHLYLSLDRLGSAHHRPIGIDAALDRLALCPRPIIKTHALPGFAAIAPEHRSFANRVLMRSRYICPVRDVRPMLCSLHRFELGCEPDVAGMSLADFIRTQRDGLSRPAAWARHINAWLDKPGVTVVKIEDIIARPAQAVTRIANALDETPTHRRHSLPQRRTGLSRTLARMLGSTESTAILGHKMGPPTNWAQALSPDDLAFIDREAGDAMARLGYTARRAPAITIAPAPMPMPAARIA